MSIPDTENDFDFYLRFAKPLVLNLNKPNERALAAAWVQKLRDKSVGSEKLRADYLKLLLFVLQRKRLTGIFSKNPNQVENLEEYPETSFHNVAKELLEIEKEHHRQEILNGSLGAKGDFPPYTIEHSADLLEYSAAQDIPNFGVHAYYAISNEPLPNWNHVEKAVFPKGVLSKPEDDVNRLNQTNRINTVSSAQPTRDNEIESDNIPKTKSKSDNKRKTNSKSRSNSASTLQHKSHTDLVDQHDSENAAVTVETSEQNSDNNNYSRKSLQSPSLDEKAEESENKQPQTWERNLISEPPVREMTTESLLEVDPSMLSSHPSMFGAESISSDCALYYSSSNNQGKLTSSSQFTQNEKDVFLKSQSALPETNLLSSSSSSKSSGKNISVERPCFALSGGKEYDMDELIQQEIEYNLRNLDELDDEGRESRIYRQSESDMLGAYSRMLPEQERANAPQRRVVRTASQRVITRQTYRNPSSALQRPLSAARAPAPPTRSERGLAGRATATNAARLATASQSTCPAQCTSAIQRPTSNTRIPAPRLQRPQTARYSSAIPNVSRIPLAGSSQMPSYQLRTTISSSRIPQSTRTISGSRLPMPTQTISGTRIPPPTRTSSRIPARGTLPPCCRPFPQGEASPFFLESPPSYLGQDTPPSFQSPTFPQGEASPFFLESPPESLDRTPTRSPDYYTTPSQQQTDYSIPSPSPRTPQRRPVYQSPFSQEETSQYPLESSFTQDETYPFPKSSYFDSSTLTSYDIAHLYPSFVSQNQTRSESPSPLPRTPPQRSPYESPPFPPSEYFLESAATLEMSSPQETDYSFTQDESFPYFSDSSYFDSFSSPKTTSYHAPHFYSTFELPNEASTSSPSLPIRTPPRRPFYQSTPVEQGGNVSFFLDSPPSPLESSFEDETSYSVPAPISRTPPFTSLYQEDGSPFLEYTPGTLEWNYPQEEASYSVPSPSLRTPPRTALYRSRSFPQGEESPFLEYTPGTLEWSYPKEGSPYSIPSPSPQTPPRTPPSYRSPPFPQGEASPFFLESPPSPLDLSSSQEEVSYSLPPPKKPLYWPPPIAQLGASPLFTKTRPDSHPGTTYEPSSSPTYSIPSPSSRTPPRTSPYRPPQFPQGEASPLFLESSSSPPQPLSPRGAFPKDVSGSPQFDFQELKELGLNVSDLGDDVFNLDEVKDLNVSQLTISSDEDHESSEFKIEDSFGRELDEYDRMIAALEAENAEDIALYGSPSPKPVVRLITPPGPAATQMQPTITAQPTVGSPKQKTPSPVRTVPETAKQKAPPPRQRLPGKVKQKQTCPKTPETEKQQVRAPCRPVTEKGKQKTITKSKTKITAVRPVKGIKVTKSVEMTKQVEKETTRVVPASIKSKSSGSFVRCEDVCGVRRPVKTKTAAPSVAQKRNVQAAQIAAEEQYKQLLQSPDRSADSFEELERVCGVTTTASEPRVVQPQAAQDSMRAVQIANEQYKQLLQHEALLDEYEQYKQRYKYRRPDVQMTPPVFSRFGHLMGPEREYHPSEFGVAEDVEWAPAEQFFEGMAYAPQNVDERGSKAKQFLSGVERDLEAERFFDTEAALEYSDYLEQIDKELAEASGFEAIKAEREPPRVSPGPQLPPIETLGDQTRVYFESPPREYYDSPVESPLSPKEARALPTPHGLPRRVVFSPRKPVDLTKMRLKSNLQDIQAKAAKQLQMLESPPQLTQQEEEDIDVYIGPERRVLMKRVAHIVSDVPDTFERRHQIKEYGIPLVSGQAGVLDETPPVIPGSPPVSPIPSPRTPSTPRRIPHSMSPAAAPVRSTVKRARPEDLVPLSLFDIDSFLDSDESFPEEFYSSPQAVSPPESPGRPPPQSPCLICRLHEAGERTSPCEHMALLQQTPKQWHRPRRRMQIPEPNVEPVYESPIKTPFRTYRDPATGIVRSAGQLAAQYRNLPELPLPEDLFGIAASPSGQEFPCGTCELDKPVPERLPSPIKAPAVVPGWVTPPRLKTPAKPIRPKLPGPAEMFIIPPIPRREIGEEMPPQDIIYSPQQLSPGSPVRYTGIRYSPPPLSPTLERDITPVIEEEQPRDLYRSPISRTPPASPGSPIESPVSLRCRLYESGEPPYYSQEEMWVAGGGTCSKRRLIKRKSAPPVLYKLREIPQAFHEEHLPFLSQVEAAKPFPRSSKKRRVIDSTKPSVEESPKKIKTITSRRKVGVDKSDPYNPVLTEIVETEETIEDAEPDFISVKDILKNLDTRYANLPELPSTAPPEELMGVAGSLKYQEQMGVLDKPVPKGLSSPIRPPAAVPGWTTPPHLRKPPPSTPRYEFKLHPNLRDIIFQEVPPPGMSPPEMSYAQTPALHLPTTRLEPQTAEIPTSEAAPGSHQQDVESSPKTPPKDVFEKQPQYLVVEMPPQELMPPGSPTTPETLAQEKLQPMSPDTTIDSFEEHEKSASESPGEAAASALPQSQPSASPTEQVKLLEDKVAQQYELLNQESPEEYSTPKTTRPVPPRPPRAAPQSPHELYTDYSPFPEELYTDYAFSEELSTTARRALQELERQLAALSPYFSSAEDAPIEQSPDTSLEEFELVEQELTSEASAKPTPVVLPRSAFDQLLNAASRANEQYAELQRNPTLLERAQQVAWDVPDPHLPQRKPAISPQKGIAIPEWSPKVPYTPQFAEQIVEEFVPEGVWSYASPKTSPPPQSPPSPWLRNVPQSAYTPRSPRPPRLSQSPHTPQTPRPSRSPQSYMATRGAPTPDIFDVEPVSEEYLDSVIELELPGSPEDRLLSPPRIEDYYRVHTPPSPGSPSQLATAVRQHAYTDRFYDRNRKLLTPSLQIKNKRVLISPMKESPFSTVKESLIEDSPELQENDPTTEIVEEVIEEVIEDIDDIDIELEQSDFRTPASSERPTVPPSGPPFYYLPDAKYAQLARQSPPLFFESPKRDIFEEAADTSGVFDSTPPADYNLSPIQLQFSPEESPVSPYFGLTTPSPESKTPSPSFRRSLKEHQLSFEKPRRKIVQPSPLERVQERYFEVPYIPETQVWRRPVTSRITRTSPPRSRTYELPKPIYYGSPEREYIRTPISQSRQPAIAQRTVTIAETREPTESQTPTCQIRSPVERRGQRNEDSPCRVCVSTRLPFEGQGSPIMDTSLIPSDLDESFIEEAFTDFKWMGG